MEKWYFLKYFFCQVYILTQRSKRWVWIFPCVFYLHETKINTSRSAVSMYVYLSRDAFWGRIFHLLLNVNFASKFNVMSVQNGSTVEKLCFPVLLIVNGYWLFPLRPIETIMISWFLFSFKVYPLMYWKENSVLNNFLQDVTV